MGEPENDGDRAAEPAKPETTEVAPAPAAEAKSADSGAPQVAQVPDFEPGDHPRETVPAHRLHGRLEREVASVIIDPTISRVEVSERQRIATERFADRARLLALVCFVSSGLTLLVVIVSLFGRIEPGTLFFLLPTGIANVVIGILLRRAAQAFTASMLPRQMDEQPLINAFEDLARAFGVQILATGLFATLLLVLLLGAFLVRRLAEM